MKTAVSACIFLLLVIFGATGALAQERYPSKPIQLVVTFASGTTTDILARAFSERLAERLGQQVVVLNRPGAGGTIATQSVAIAAPDGYTLLIANSSHSINPGLYTRLPYDTLRDFAGLAMVAETPYVVVVNPQLGTRTLKEFIALARKKPESVNYGSAGLGSATHLAGAYFASLAGIELLHVPYKNTQELTTDLLAGRINAIFTPPPFVLTQIRDQRLWALGVSGNEAMHAPIEVPTAKDAANVNYEYAGWFGFLAHAKTPAPVMEQVSRALQQVADEKAVRDRYQVLGLVSRVMLLREFDAYIRADLEKLRPVIKASGAVIN